MLHILHSHSHEILSHEICKLSDSLTCSLAFWRMLNKQPSLPLSLSLSVLVDSLLSSLPSFLSPLTVLLLSLPSSHSFTYSPLHSFPPSHSLTPSPAGIQLTALTDAGLVLAHTNEHVTKTRLDAGNRLEEEREKQRRGMTPPLLSDSPKLRKTGEWHGRRSLRRSMRVYIMAWPC